MRSVLKTACGILSHMHITCMQCDTQLEWDDGWQHTLRVFCAFPIPTLQDVTFQEEPALV